MKRITFLIFPLLIISLAILSCVSSPPKNENSEIWKSKKWGYSFNVPKYWRIADTNSPSVKSNECDSFVENPIGGSTAIFAYYGLNKSYTHEEILEDIIGKYRSVFSELEIIKNEKYKKNNYEVLIAQFEGFVNDEKMVEIYAIIFSEKVDLLISSSCSSKTLPSNEQGFYSILNSIMIF